MRVLVVAAGTRLPGWQNDGFAEYARRMPRESPLELKEIAVARGAGAGDLKRAQRQEGERMLAALSAACWVVALEVGGATLDTPGLARWWAGWLNAGRDLAFLIGGPEGLSSECRARADERLSLSALTFPHGLARVLLAEQLYRAASLLKGHPYHRA